MAIEEGDFVKINFTGIVKSTGDVYATTIEELAHEANIYDENTVYSPSVFILGSHQTFVEIEEELVGHEVGDKIRVEIPSERAFGSRNPKLIKTMHIKEFKKTGLNPYPGLLIQSEGSTGRVLTVNGGRVKVDFNNELAGKDIICEVEVCDIVEDLEEKIKGLILLRLAFPTLNVEKTKIELDGDVLNIVLDPIIGFIQETNQTLSLAKFNIARDIYENIEGINQVNFVEEHKKPVEEEPADEEETSSEDEVETSEEN